MCFSLFVRYVFQGSEETASPYKQLERMETNNLLRKAIAELPEKYQA
jgi:hypothetical protein